MAGAGIRVGVDLVSVQRVAEFFQRRGAAFLADHFTAAEQRQLGAVADGRLETLAGRIAAKEALIKVLAPLEQVIAWRDVEVLAEPGRAPTARFHGAAEALARVRGLGAVDVSISHEGAWAVAVAAGAVTTGRHDDGERRER